MNAITVLFAIIAALAVFVIAATVIGREAHRLDALAPRAIYDIDEATSFVADRLPSYAELRKMLAMHMSWLESKGLQPQDVTDRRQDITESVVFGEETLTAYLLGKAADARIEVLDDVDVVHVVRAHLDYFEAIGAVGPSASSTDL
jgi:uncharacterized membrane protein